MKDAEFKIKLTKSQQKAVETLLFARHKQEEERDSDDISPHTTAQKIGMLWNEYLMLLERQLNVKDSKIIDLYKERCLVVKDLETLLGYFPTEKEVRDRIPPDAGKFDESLIPVILKDLEKIQEVLEGYPKLVSSLGKILN